MLTSIRSTRRTHTDDDGATSTVYEITLRRPSREDTFDVYVRSGFLPGLDAALVTASNELLHDLRGAPVVVSWICHEVGRAAADLAHDSTGASAHRG
jgi:hypothetical protein